jgi:WD40 repeat protein
MVFSPDGEYLAVTTANLPAVQIWRLSEASLFKAIEIPNAWNSCLAFSPDGSLLAVGKPEGVEFWQVSDGLRLQTFGVPIPYIEGQFHNVTSLAFSPDGALIATADINPYKSNRQVNVWRMKDGRLLRRFNGYKAGIDGLAFGPDNQFLAVGSGARVDLYRATTGTLLRAFSARRAGQPKTIDLSFNTDGSALSFVLSDGYVQTSQISTGKVLAAWEIMPVEDGEALPNLAQAAFSADGSRLASLETDKTLRLWRVDGTLLGTLDGHFEDYHQLVLSLDGSLLGAALGGAGDIQVWRLNDLDLGFVVRQSGFVYPLQLTSLAFSPDGKAFAASGPGAKFWQTGDGTPERTIESSELRKMGLRDILAFSPDLEQMVVSAIAGDKEQTWLARTADLTKLYKLAEAPRKDVSNWSDLVFARDRSVAAGSRKGTVSIWRTRDGKLLASFDEQARCLVFASGGGILATCRSDRIRLWQVDNGDLLETIKAPQDIQNDGFTSLAFSPDGKIIATGTVRGKIWVWEAASGALLGTLDGHKGSVTGIVFTPDGKRIISAAEDGTLRVWGIH